MPDGWVHATIDLIVYGRPYFSLHKKKDDPSQTLGRKHRIVRHNWYQAFGEKWTFDEPFPSRLKKRIVEIRDAKGPAKAEEYMAYTDHDYIDRIWDDLSAKEREYWEGFFMWVLFNPKILKEWAKVDILEGRIHRVVNNHEVWEDCPELKSEYRRLRSYVNTVKEKDKNLQKIIERYG
jgi:hypothetical protein